MELTLDNQDNYFDDIYNFLDCHNKYEKLVKSRKNVVDKIYLYASRNKYFNKKEHNKKLLISLYIENICYNNTIEIAIEKNIDRNWECDHFCNLYDNLSSKILEFIDNNKLIDFDLTYNYTDIIKNTVYNVYPQFYNEEFEFIASRNNIQLIKNYSTKLICPKCAQATVLYILKQYRCSDEPPQYKCICDTCGFKFKKNSIN